MDLRGGYQHLPEALKLGLITPADVDRALMARPDGLFAQAMALFARQLAEVHAEYRDTVARLRMQLIELKGRFDALEFAGLGVHKAQVPRVAAKAPTAAAAAELDAPLRRGAHGPRLRPQEKPATPSLAYEATARTTIGLSAPPKRRYGA